MELNKRLWEIKLELKKIRKVTPGFKFKYVNLPDVEKNIRPLLIEYKVGYRFKLGTTETGGNVLELIIFEADKIENSESHSLSIPKGVSLTGMNEYQALGSGITYFRRYLLVTAFGIIADDDVDALIPKATPVVEVNHLTKIKDLVTIGRAKASLEKYYGTYQKDMTDEQKKEATELIKNVTK